MLCSGSLGWDVPVVLQCKGLLTGRGRVLLGWLWRGSVSWLGLKNHLNPLACSLLAGKQQEVRVLNTDILSRTHMFNNDILIT